MSPLLPAALTSSLLSTSHHPPSDFSTFHSQPCTHPLSLFPYSFSLLVPWTPLDSSIVLSPKLCNSLSVFPVLKPSHWAFSQLVIFSLWGTIVLLRFGLVSCSFLVLCGLFRWVWERGFVLGLACRGRSLVWFWWVGTRGLKGRIVCGLRFDGVFIALSVYLDTFFTKPQLRSKLDFSQIQVS